MKHTTSRKPLECFPMPLDVTLQGKYYGPLAHGAVCYQVLQYGGSATAGVCATTATLRLAQKLSNFHRTMKGIPLGRLSNESRSASPQAWNHRRTPQSTPLSSPLTPPHPTSTQTYTHTRPITTPIPSDTQRRVAKPWDMFFQGNTTEHMVNKQRPIIRSMSDTSECEDMNMNLGSLGKISKTSWKRCPLC